MIKQLYILILFTASLFANITLEDSENFEMNMEENLTIDGTLSIPSDSNFTAREDSSINISGDFINQGNFTPSTSTLRFFGAGVSAIKGESEFYNFFSNKNLSFEANKTQEITNSITIKDADINSSLSGVQGIINLATVKKITLKNLNIKDSKVIGRAEAINPPNSTDRGNNFMWFGKKSSFTNTGSGYEWFEKLEDFKNQKTLYLTKDSNKSNEVVFSSSIDVVATPIDDKKVVKFDYVAVADSGKSCSKNIEITLGKKELVSGFKGCDYEDPTLKGWKSFKGAKVFIKDLGEELKSVIVIDVNLTSPLVIGGVHER